MKKIILAITIFLITNSIAIAEIIEKDSLIEIEE
jgi:hypothetical protein